MSTFTPSEPMPQVVARIKRNYSDITIHIERSKRLITLDFRWFPVGKCDTIAQAVDPDSEALPCTDFDKARTLLIEALAGTLADKSQVERITQEAYSIQLTWSNTGDPYQIISDIKRALTTMDITSCIY